MESVSDGDVRGVLNRQTLSSEDFLCLLSPAAEAHLVRMAQQAHSLTVVRFGRTTVLHTPLYLSNFCTNGCLYCGFNRDSRITWESARFRDRLLPLGVTRMSAVSCTAVGGRSDPSGSTGQFEISDERSVEEMVAMLRRAGWQPVFQDWRGLGE